MLVAVNIAYLIVICASIFIGNAIASCALLLSSLYFLIKLKVNIYRKLFFIVMCVLAAFSLYIKFNNNRTLQEYIIDSKVIVGEGGSNTIGVGNTNENDYTVSSSTAEALVQYRSGTDKIVQDLLVRLNNKETISPEEIKANFDKAITLADQSIATANIPYTNITKGRVFESFTLFTASNDIKSQFLQSALSYYLVALNQDSKDAENYATVARLYAMVPAEKDKAVAAITKAIELSQSDDQVKLYTKILETLTK